MAYGNLKADNLIYDDNGTDTVVPLEHVAGKATLASPAFTGVPTAPTANAGTDSTQIATTAYVDQSFAPLANPAFTGSVTIDRATTGEDIAKFKSDGSCELYHNDVLRLSTTNVAVDVSGILTVSGDANFGSTSNTSITSSSDGAGGWHTMLENSSTGDLYLRGTEFYLQDNTTGNSNQSWIHCQPSAGVKLYYDGALSLQTSDTGIQVQTNLYGLEGLINYGSSGNCQISAYSNNGINSAEDNDTFKIYSQHGNNNATKTGILYQSFFDQVWRVQGGNSSGCSGIEDAELGRINHDGGWELRYHDVQGTAPNWTGTTCDKKLETTADGVTITGNLIVNGTTTEINSTTLTVDDKNIELGKGTGSVTTGQSATLTAGVNTVTVASTAGYLPKAALTNLTGTANAFGSATPFVKSITSSTEFTVGDGAGNDLNHVNSGAVGFDVGAASDLTANGGGITLKGSTDKTILWTDSTDSWDFNQDIKTSGTVTDSKGDVRKIPAGQFGTVTLADTDAGKFVAASGAVGLGANVFAIGDAVTIFCNHTADITLTFTGITCYLAGEDVNKASLTLATRGIATLLCVASNTYVISGAGLS